MKKCLLNALFAAAFLFAASAAYAQYSVPCYHEAGGARWVASSGCDIDVESGGEIDVESGAELKIGGTSLTPTAAQFNVIDDAPVQNPGRDFFTICGEATTVNNNTVYYGPNTGTLVAAAGGQTCSIDEAGNVTEATADAPIYGAKAFHVLGMTCRNEADANANISYTLRTAAGATVPSVTCTIADGERDCVADIQTTTAIASGATVAVAVASTGNVGDNNGFVCTVSTAY